MKRNGLVSKRQTAISEVGMRDKHALRPKIPETRMQSRNTKFSVPWVKSQRHNQQDGLFKMQSEGYPRHEHADFPQEHKKPSQAELGISPDAGKAERKSRPFQKRCLQRVSSVRHSDHPQSENSRGLRLTTTEINKMSARWARTDALEHVPAPVSTHVHEVVTTLETSPRSLAGQSNLTQDSVVKETQSLAFIFIDTSKLCLSYTGPMNIAMS